MLSGLAAGLSTFWQRLKAGAGALWSSPAARVLVALLVGGLVAVGAMRDCDSSASSWWNLACPESDVAIFVQSPEVYTRARLLNDRNEQKNWLTGQLELTKDSGKFITLEEEERRSIEETLRIGVRATKPSTSEDPSSAPPNPSGNEGGATPRGISPRTTETIALERRPTGLLFESMSKFRDDIRSELSRIQLDDRHDLGGNTAYTLRFPTSVVGDFGAGRVGVVFVKAKLLPVDVKRVEPALESWRSHVQSVYSSSLRDIALSLSGSADQSLEDLGLSSSDFREYVVHKMLCRRIESFCPPHERNLHAKQDPTTKIMATRDGRTLLPAHGVTDEMRDKVELFASEVRTFLPKYLQVADELNGLLEEWAYYQRLDTLDEVSREKAPHYLQAINGCFGLPEFPSLPPAEEAGLPTDLVTGNENQIKWRYARQNGKWQPQFPCPSTDRGTAWIAGAVFRLIDARNFGDWKARGQNDPVEGIQIAVEALTTTLKAVTDCRTTLMAVIPPPSTQEPGLPRACETFIAAPADVTPAKGSARRVSAERWGFARVQEFRCSMADFRAYQATWRRYLSPAGYQISFSDFFDVIAIRYGHQGCDLEVRVKHRGDRLPDRSAQPSPQGQQSSMDDAICKRLSDQEVGVPVWSTAYVQSLCALTRELRENHSIFALGLSPPIQKRTVNKEDQRNTNVGGQFSPVTDLASISASLASQRSNMRVSKDSVATVVSFVPHRPKPLPASAARQATEADTETAFGWVFLPDSANVKARQFDLSATLSLPGWVTEIDLEVNTCIGTPRDLSRSIEVVLHKEQTSTGQGGESPALKCHEALLGRIRLPGEPPEITRKLNLEVFNIPHIKVVPGINDYRASGPVLRAGYRGVLLIPGRRLWKNTYVSLGDQLANEISILPDMEGIIATFRCVNVPNEVSIWDWRNKQFALEGRPSSPPGEQAPRVTKLARVWTSEGATVPIIVQIQQIGPVNLCEDQEPARITAKPASAPSPSPQAKQQQTQPQQQPQPQPQPQQQTGRREG